MYDKAFVCACARECMCMHAHAHIVNILHLLCRACREIPQRSTCACVRVCDASESLLANRRHCGLLNVDVAACTYLYYKKYTRKPGDYKEDGQGEDSATASSVHP